LIYRLVIAVTIVFAAVCQSAAEVVIDGPKNVPIGGLCIVTVQGLKADDSLSWAAVPEIQVADLIDRRGQPVLLVPTNKIGTYHLVLAFLDSGKVTQKVHSVKVGEPDPPPTPPEPEPGPEPEPQPEPIPDGKLGFSRMAYTEAMKVHSASRGKAKNLAENFESTASAIAAGAVRSVDEANALMVSKNRAVLSDAERPAWLSFFTAWQQKADAALKDGSLKQTVSDYQAIYEATSQGLRRVK
jgi:hypothetical protein